MTFGHNFASDDRTVNDRTEKLLNINVLAGSSFALYLNTVTESVVAPND